MVNSFADVIDALGGTSRFASSVGMKPNTAKMARARDSISPVWWPSIVDVAREQDIQEITLERLAELAAHRRAA